jgi:hypothetical protein
MSTLVRHDVVSEPVAVRVTADAVSVDLADGRMISVPLQWFPRLLHATPDERADYELSSDGIHWPQLNEDISVEGLLLGERSGESQRSLRRWLEYRARGEREPIPTLLLPPDVERELRRIGITWDE